MKVRYNLPLFLSFCLGFLLFTPFIASSYQTKDLDINKFTDLEKRNYIEKLMQSMTDEEKVGQLLMVGLQEKYFSASTKSHLQKIQPGFIILFKKNIETPSQTLALIKNVEKQNSKKIPPLFSVDQEGGDVVRIPTSPPIPTALAVGELKDLDLAKNLGVHIGHILSEFHIYMNLAPVLDLTEYSPISFIQTRSYGVDPKNVSLMAKNFIEGLSTYGILSTAKHFPGIGYTSNDSHKSISFADLSEEEIIKSLEPYKNLIREEKLDAVMMTHHIYKNMDSLPATFSKKIIDILRVRFEFKGLIITDDVEMTGAKIYKTAGERAVQAILAGNDVVMVAWNKKSQLQAHASLLKAYKTGLISKERVAASLTRILTAKLKTPLFQSSFSPLAEVLATLKNEDLKRTVTQILEKKVSQEFNLTKQNLSLSTFKSYYVISPDFSFLKEFKKTSRLPMRTFLLNSQSDMRSLKAKPSELVVFHVNGPKTQILLASLLSKKNTSFQLDSHFLVVNSRFRGLLESFKVPILHIQMRHPLLGKEIAHVLDFNIPRDLSSEIQIKSAN